MKQCVVYVAPYTSLHLDQFPATCRMQGLRQRDHPSRASGLPDLETKVRSCSYKTTEHVCGKGGTFSSECAEKMQRSVVFRRAREHLTVEFRFGTRNLGDSIGLAGCPPIRLASGWCQRGRPMGTHSSAVVCRLDCQWHNAQLKS